MTLCFMFVNAALILHHQALTESSSLQCTVDKFVSIARAGLGQLIMGYISKPLEGLIIGYL